MQRPTVITILAVLSAIVGVLGLLGSLASTMGASLLERSTPVFTTSIGLGR